MTKPTPGAEDGPWGRKPRQPHDPEFQEILGAFLARLGDRLGRIRQALQRADFDAASESAHQIKGSAGMFGFMDLRTSAEALEEAASRCDAPQALHFLAECNDLVTILQAQASGGCAAGEPTETSQRPAFDDICRTRRFADLGRLEGRP